MDYEKLLDRAYAALPHKSEVSERFEMPVAETFLQGSKTIFKNFDSIVGKIRREPELLTKYFSKELAVPCTVAGGKLTLHGKFYDRTINEKLSDFINSYVVCKECKKPDTRLMEGQHGIKTLVCEACGARAPVK